MLQAYKTNEKFRKTVNLIKRNELNEYILHLHLDNKTNLNIIKDARKL